MSALTPLVKVFGGMTNEGFQALVSRAKECSGDAAACTPLIQQLEQAILQTERERLSCVQIQAKNLSDAKNAAEAASGSNYASKQAINNLSTQALSIRLERDRLLLERVADITVLAQAAIASAGNIRACEPLIGLLGKKAQDFASSRDELIREADVQQKETDKKVQQARTLNEYFGAYPLYMTLPATCNEIRSLLFEQLDLPLETRQEHLAAKKEQWEKVHSQRMEQLAAAQPKVRLMSEERDKLSTLILETEKRNLDCWEMDNLFLPLISATFLLLKAKKASVLTQLPNLQAQCAEISSQYQSLESQLLALSEGKLNHPQVDVALSQTKARQLLLELNEELTYLSMRQIVIEVSVKGWPLSAELAGDVKPPEHKYTSEELAAYQIKHHGEEGKDKSSSYESRFKELAQLTKKWRDLPKPLPTLSLNQNRDTTLRADWTQVSANLLKIAQTMNRMEDWLRSRTSTCYWVGVLRCTRYTRWLDEGPDDPVPSADI